MNSNFILFSLFVLLYFTVNGEFDLTNEIVIL